LRLEGPIRPVSPSRPVNVAKASPIPATSRVSTDASIGYRMRGIGGALEGLTIEGSVTNLTDKRYISTIGTNGYVASGDNQTLLAGAPRQWFVTLRRGF
jgi:iron complex outermembrane receptor protein